jgi:hypothetical protein
LNGYRKSVFASSASLLSPKNSFFDFFACQTSKMLFNCTREIAKKEAEAMHYAIELQKKQATET